MAVSGCTQDASILTVTCNVTATARLNPNDMPTQNCMFPNDVNGFNWPINKSSMNDQQPMASLHRCSNIMEIAPEHGYTGSSFNEASDSNDILECMEHEDQMFHWINVAPHNNCTQVQSYTYTTETAYNDQSGYVDHLPYDVNHDREYVNFQSGPFISPQLDPSHQYPMVNQVKECTELLDLNSPRLGDSFGQTSSWNQQQHRDVHTWGNDRRNESEPEDWIESSSTTSPLENHQQAWGGRHDFSADSSSSYQQSWHESDDIQYGNGHDAQRRSPFLNQEDTERTQNIKDALYSSSNDGQPAVGIKKYSVTDKKKTHCTEIEESVEQDSKNQSRPVDVDHLISSGVMVAGYKPRNIIRKRSKTSVPKTGKDNWYWEKRRKNNESARRSRELKKEKEKDFYRRALELEYENFFLKERIGYLETQLSCSGQPTADVC